MLHEIFRADLSLGEIGVGSITTGGDNGSSIAFPVQVKSVIQARFQHRRRASIVLSGTKHNDRVRRMNVVAHSPIANLAVDVDTINEEHDEYDNPREYSPF